MFDLNFLLVNKKKRVYVYPNGQMIEKAQSCWASSLGELSESANVKLRLPKPIKFFFTEDGKIVSL